MSNVPMLRSIVCEAETELLIRGRKANLPDLSRTIEHLRDLCLEHPFNPTLDGLRLTAQLCEGLRSAWDGPARWKWQKAAIFFDTHVRLEVTSQLAGSTPMYAFLEMNRAIAYHKAGMSGLAISAANHALGFFANFHTVANKWRARAYLVRALEHVRERQESALQAQELLLNSGEKELQALVQKLLGDGDGRLKGSGWLGTNFMATQAAFGPHHLYALQA